MIKQVFLWFAQLRGNTLRNSIFFRTYEKVFNGPLLLDLVQEVRDGNAQEGDVEAVGVVDHLPQENQALVD